ncbi:2-oxoglutarate dehydrogenase complex dihydrolipoyllysine-residue succinyltransferase [Pseudoalteromonas luteoviolacea]|uniref:Dihydrolipoyllysine-residue succinyltransferase component of 2-oxoglutarate dehydrogenase complex n=1 Tax=Pseudoalteromonas luteoviolacea S4054 TaxID=1129367 RepID=A0A0F6ABE7_9GAMM|nr:2-oxoglutarate dehydrogenase complex dihydrolipoyllysine-residue succinyltransferase [Pseudoalteromonas luteoviolacea]AOT08540.1 dihydrolipoamide succinyltransferase [Pseudoalteromonas luteoviolacea]AOT13456.1 dihydrolipoamide succinyltransferase [Pseudoalteromonas luteoviolacea]AOT18369.1 dihydrolipoamide succinyltransferase [Pseudoalteromonas luteoviolacea]KKE83463.1 dihydrolipoamide succinyltransferase [Pseudoalteromonas luteoviolacea S4054]KZN75900.1 dihydrolipoamide succinyltransferase
MTTEIKVPVLPESVADATVATWHVSVGDTVSRDQNLVDIETDKVVLEVVAPEDGVIVAISEEEGATVLGEQVIAQIGAAGAAPAQSNEQPAAPAAAAPAAEGKEVDIKVPVLPESVADATIATWHVQPGEAVSRDQNLVDIETDKVVLEVVAPEDGVMGEHLHAEGDTVLGEQVIGKLSAGGAPAAPAQVDAAPAASDENADVLTPSVRRLIAEKGLDASQIKGSGKGGRITKEDVDAFLKAPAAKPAAAPAKAAAAAPAAPVGDRTQKRVPMTRLRKTIANRLLEAKNSTAMLTTFNEVNMKPIMDLRKQYKDVFEERHGIRLGFMSFYVKAVTEALKRFPEVNASIDGDDIVYHNYFDISIAVSTPRGLVTPVLRDCDKLSVAEIEKGIRELALKGRDGKLTVDDMTGGNFTITNGGVFGSLLSTPIINLPQSSILGMHKIQERPMAVNGKVEILPMMYLALSYDHRQIDGKESVGFLVTIKELLEDPTRLLLDV